MPARALYAAVALTVLGAFPRSPPPEREPLARPEPAPWEPSWTAREASPQICAAGDPRAADWRPPDFAIPRIHR